MLSEIDPGKDALVRNLALPTIAEKLVLAPGKENWIALEQGPQTDLARQKTESLLWVPTEWIEGKTSPLPRVWEGSAPEPLPPLELCRAAS